MAASILLKTGIRLPNKAVRPAPSLPIAIFQIRKQMTDAASPRYRIDKIRWLFHVTVADRLSSQIKKGNTMSVPKEKITNKKFTGEIPAGFFLTSVLYTAKQNAANSIHRSPVLKCSDNKFLKFPFDKRKSTPIVQRIMPANFIQPIFSCRKMRAKIMDMMGEDVVPINARFMAEV